MGHEQSGAETMAISKMYRKSNRCFAEYDEHYIAAKENTMTLYIYQAESNDPQPSDRLIATYQGESNAE